MTELLALMNAAVEGTLTNVSAVENADPLFFDHLAVVGHVFVTALLLLVQIAAEQILLHLTAIATSRQANLAGTA